MTTIRLYQRQPTPQVPSRTPTPPPQFPSLMTEISSGLTLLKKFVAPEHPLKASYILLPASIALFPLFYIMTMFYASQVPLCQTATGSNATLSPFGPDSLPAQMMSGNFPLCSEIPLAIAWGGLYTDYSLTENSWRLAGYVMFHESPSHLLGNLAALIVALYVFERRFGAIRCSLVMAISAAGSGITSLVFSDPHTVIFGVSGAICGLVAVTFIDVLVNPYAVILPRWQLIIGTTIIAALVIGAAITPDANIDTAGHLGGFFTGLAAASIFLPRFCPHDHRELSNWLRWWLPLILSLVIFLIVFVAFPVVLNGRN